MKDIKLHVGVTGNDSWIEVDSEKLGYVQSVEIKVAAQELSEVTIRMIPHSNVDVEIEPEVWKRAVAKAEVVEAQSAFKELRKYGKEAGPRMTR